MQWYSECTANWREKWSRVKYEKDKAKHELKLLKNQLELSNKELSQEKAEKNQLKNEIAQWKSRLNELNNGVPFEEIRIEEHGTVKINKIGENYDKIIINDDLRQPKISSKHREYKIGDIVDVNCMLKPVPPYQVYLEWFINEKPVS